MLDEETCPFEGTLSAMEPGGGTSESQQLRQRLPWHPSSGGVLDR